MAVNLRSDSSRDIEFIIVPYYNFYKGTMTPVITLFSTAVKYDATGTITMCSMSGICQVTQVHNVSMCVCTAVYTLRTWLYVLNLVLNLVLKVIH